MKSKAWTEKVMQGVFFIAACTSVLAVALIVRARPCFTLWSFSLIRKTELWKTNKPPAVRVVEVASAYSIKPPVL